MKMEFIDYYIESKFQVMFDELNVQIECHEIMNAIDQLHFNKSSGPDSVINECLISGKHMLCPYLCTLFNTVFRSGHIPRSTNT